MRTLVLEKPLTMEPEWEDCAEADFSQESYECIQTYDRKKLKMKKHQRQKLKK
jgi:hypothetical protein